MSTDIAPDPSSTHAGSAPGKRTGTLRDTASSVVGAVLGVAPHVLHHVGFIAGSAVLTGAGGSVAFYAVGLLLSIPMLRRLYHRFGGWAAPGIAVVVFSAIFAVSNLLIGPALTGSDGQREPAPTSPTQPIDQHSGHHG